jgi:ABC-type transporter Mla MlaB component
LADAAVSGPVDEAMLAISGPVTLAEVSRWRESLLAALGRGVPVNLDVADAGPWDASGVQLVVSAVRTSRTTGPAVRLSRVPNVFLAIADQAGISEWLADAIHDRLA